MRGKRRAAVLRDPSDVERLMDELRAISVREWCICAVGLHTGLMAQELLSLRIDEVWDFRRGGPHHLVRVQGRTLPLNELTRDALREYIGSCGRDWQSGDYLFYSTQHPHKAISRQRVDLVLQRAARQAGIEGSVSLSSLRKTYAYFRLLDGDDLNELADRMGYARTEGLTLLEDVMEAVAVC